MGQANVENDVKQLQKESKLGGMAVDKLESQLKELVKENNEFKKALDELKKALDLKKDKKTAEQEADKREAALKKEMERQDAENKKEMERQLEVRDQKLRKEQKQAYAETHKKNLEYLEEMEAFELRIEALDKTVKHLLSQPAIPTSESAAVLTTCPTTRQQGGW